MKKVFILLLIFVVASCKSDFDKDNLKFEIHKFNINNSDQLGCYGYDLDNYNKISIDSIKEYPKHIYFQEKIEWRKSSIENHIKNEEYYNPNLFYESLLYQEQKLDSLKKTFSKTDKNELYFKCYFSYPSLGYSNIIMLNGKYKPIECQMAELKAE